MRNFDEYRKLRAEADRGFQIGGETFVRRASVRPEATSAWEAVGSTPDLDSKDVLEAMDQTVLALIEPGEKGEAHKRWKALRAREEDAVNLADMLDVITWLVEEQSQRPTQPSSNSSGEPEPTGTSSTDGSSSPDAQEVPTA